MSTIHEVAKAAGVSTATVSRSFTDSNQLTEATRQRVLDVARRLNYHPPHARPHYRVARIPRNTETGSAIGFQFFAPSDTATIHSDAFYAPMLAGAVAESQERQLHLLLHTTDRRRLSYEIPRMIREQAIEGMLLVGTADKQILLDFLEHVPQIVLVDNRDVTGRHDCVLSDGIGGASSAVNYLFELGHRRIGFFMSESETATFQDRLTGYLSAHYKRGVVIDPDLIVATRTLEEFEARSLALLRQPSRPTAFLTANDPHAYRMIQICYSLGLHIPDDVSVMGFDDDRFSSLSTPPLTTMRVDAECMGRLAVRRLHARLQESRGNLAPEPHINIEVPVALVERGSCRPLSAS